MVSMVGHDRILKDLKTSAERGGLSHSYLFYGPAMVGKRFVAERFMRWLETGEADGTGILQDGLFVAPDEKGTIGIDVAREMKQFLWRKPAVSQYRTAIIDDAERLTTEAMNALLKIAEEPPRSTLLILITSDPDAILPTLSSRLFKLYFRIPPKSEVTAWLMAEFKLKKTEAEALASRSFGKPGLAVRLQTDERLQEYIQSAEKLLKLPGDAQRTFIKKLLDDDEFDLLAFLDAMMFLASRNVRTERNRAFWHDLLALRQNAANFNLNPRLQLENLLQ